MQPLAGFDPVFSVHNEHPDAHMTSVHYVHVDDADEVAADWRKAGLNVVGPKIQDYGKREGRHMQSPALVESPFDEPRHRPVSRPDERFVPAR